MKRWISMALALIIITSSTAIAKAEASRIGITGKPSGITAANDGKLLVTDTWDMAIWELDGTAVKKLTSDGVRDLLGRVAGGRKNGSIASSTFGTPFAITPYRDGYAVSDTDNHLIRFISGDSTETSTIAGSGYAGLVNSISTQARFNRPTGLAADNDGNLYIADTDNNIIRKLDKNGNVSTFAGDSEGYTVGSMNETRFNMPTGLCWYNGKLYVADSGNHRIVVIENGRSRVLTGGVKNREDEDELNGGSYRNGSLEMAGFSNPQGILADTHGIYVADTGNGAVRRIADGLVTTLETFLSPRGMVFIENSLYVCDTNTNFVFTIADDRPAPSYLDIDPDLPWYGAALEMYEHDIFVGIDDNTFAPFDTMTRGQYIKALSNVHNFLFPDTIIAGESENFTDVPEGGYYTDAVYWSRSMGVTAGTGENMFSPDLMITREAAASFLYNYAEIAGYGISGGNSAFTEFSDSAQTSGWAVDAMTWAVSSGIFSAEPNGELNPRGEASRGWIAQMFMNFICLKK